MFLLRYALIAVSGLLLLIMLAFWTVSGSLTDIVSLIVFLYLGSNLFYLVFSHPTFKASGFFQRAATGLAFASLELRHQAKEAELREIEAERLRNLDSGSKAYKLRAATEFLQYIRENPTIKKYYSLESPQEAAKLQENVAIAALPNDQRAIASPQSSAAPAPGSANPQLPIKTQSPPSKGSDMAVQTTASASSPPQVQNAPHRSAIPEDQGKALSKRRNTSPDSDPELERPSAGCMPERREQHAGTDTSGHGPSSGGSEP